MQPPHVGDRRDDLRSHPDSSHGVVHGRLAVRDRKGRGVGAEPRSRSGSSPRDPVPYDARALGLPDAFMTRHLIVDLRPRRASRSSPAVRTRTSSSAAPPAARCAFISSASDRTLGATDPTDPRGHECAADTTRHATGRGPRQPQPARVNDRRPRIDEPSNLAPIPAVSIDELGGHHTGAKALDVLCSRHTAADQRGHTTPRSRAPSRALSRNSRR